MLELKVIFFGMVQGVGFRAATVQLARAMDLKGYVKNLDDGAVELLAQGDKKHLDQLLDGLGQVFGPRLIDRIEKTFGSPEHLYESFAIAN